MQSLTYTKLRTLALGASLEWRYSKATDPFHSSEANLAWASDCTLSRHRRQSTCNNYYFERQHEIIISLHITEIINFGYSIYHNLTSSVFSNLYEGLLGIPLAEPNFTKG